MILIGDPKQAIYAFRGGDIVTYLQAAETAGDKKTLGTNWRSDAALVERLQVVLRGAELGDPAIVVHDVEAHHQGHRLAGAPRNDPFRLRVVRRATLGRSGIAEPARSTNCGSTSAPTSPPTSARCWPAARRSTASRCRPATSP